jgi:hypothetical protein
MNPPEKRLVALDLPSWRAITGQVNLFVLLLCFFADYVRRLLTLI